MEVEKLEVADSGEKVRNYFLHNLKMIVSLTLIVFVLVGSGLAVYSINKSQKTLNKMVEINIKNDFYDVDYNCELINCKLVKMDEFMVFQNEKTNKVTPSFYMTIGGIKLAYYKEFMVGVSDRYGVVYYVTNFKETSLLSVFILVFLLVYLYTQYKLFDRIGKEESEETSILLSYKESMLQHKILAYLTLNIHHELNSPLLMILSGIEDIEDNLQSSCIVSCINSKIPADEMVETLSLMKDSVSQIRSVIDGMREFKSVEISNGDKNIYDIIHSSVTLLDKVRVEHFDEVKIDENFKKYGINHERGFKNSVLSNIIINHLKNSLNANATSIQFEMVAKYPNNNLKLFIIDNGNGIPEEFIDKVFEPYATTSLREDSEGVGMYTNKILLNKFGGNVWVESSEVGRTVIGIAIPVLKHEEAG